MERGRIDPWEQRPHEGAKAYAAARLYFELGADRSIREVARRLDRSSTFIGRWSKRHQWTRRARLYDRHLAQIELKSRERLAKEVAEQWALREQELRERKYKLADSMMTKAEHMLNFPLAKQRIEDEPGGKRVTVVQPAKWTMFSVARLAATGVDMAHSAILNERASDREGNEEEEYILEDLRPPEAKP